MIWTFQKIACYFVHLFGFKKAMMAPYLEFGKSANPIKIEGRGHIMPTTLLIAPILILKLSTGSV